MLNVKNIPEGMEARFKQARCQIKRQRRYTKKSKVSKKDDFIEYCRCAEGVDGCWYFLINYFKTEKRVFDKYGQEFKEEDYYPDYDYLYDLMEGFILTGNVADVKSRQMLWSYTAAGVLLWFLTFGQNFAAKVTSYKEEKVDDGGIHATTESIFGKLRYGWERLPDVLRAPLQFSYLRIKNPGNNSFVKGESTNTKAGRGGTYNIIIADEWAFVDKSESIYASMHSACPNNKKLGSTPNGKGNNFARIVHTDPMLTGFRVNRWHWKLNPDKTPEWYKREIRGLTKEQIAREYEMSFEGSVEGRVYYNFDHLKQIVQLDYNPELPLYTTWDFGIADPTSIIWIQENPNGEIYIIDEYENNEEEPDHYANIVKLKPYHRRVRDIGDPSAKQRGVTKDSWESLLRQEGISIVSPYSCTIDERIMSTRQVIPRIYVSDRCVRFIDCISNYKYPTDDVGKPTAEKPIHDEFSHMMSALEFYSVFRFGVTTGLVTGS
jgi:hypothetical protein